ncbi:protein of unknown function [Paraburkholderia kururiensis]
MLYPLDTSFHQAWTLRLYYTRIHY